MKLWPYIKYFYFLFINWNLKIAWYMIMQETKGEKKYGIDTTGADELQQLENMGIDISHATIYMPVSYDLLEEIFNHICLSGSVTPKQFTFCGYWLRKREGSLCGGTLWF